MAALAGELTDSLAVPCRGRDLPTLAGFACRLSDQPDRASSLPLGPGCRELRPLRDGGAPSPPTGDLRPLDANLHRCQVSSHRPPAIPIPVRLRNALRMDFDVLSHQRWYSICTRIATPHARRCNAQLNLRNFNTVGPMLPERYRCIPPLSRVNLDEIVELIKDKW